MVGSLSICLVGTFLLAFSDILWLSVAGMWLMTFGLTIPLNLTFCYITEMVQEKDRQEYTVVVTFAF